MYFQNVERNVIFKDQVLHEELDCLTPKIKKLCTFETSKTIHPATQSHIPEHLDPQMNACSFPLRGTEDPGTLRLPGPLITRRQLSEPCQCFTIRG